MIPMVIHYVWLGGNPLPPMIKKCIHSWKENLPGFEIVCWNETNLKIEDPVYLRNIKNKKWAFAADIARLHILKLHGGVYLDTDMEVIKDLKPLLDTELFIGYEDNFHINAGIVGCTAYNKFVSDALDAVCKEQKKALTPIPQILTHTYNTNKKNYKFKHEVYSPEYFYPYNPFTSEVKNLFYSDITSNTYAIHHWAHSWKPNIIKRILGHLKKIVA